MNMQVNSWPLHILWIKYPIILGNKQMHATCSTCFYFFQVDEQKSRQVLMLLPTTNYSSLSNCGIYTFSFFWKKIPLYMPY